MRCRPNYFTTFQRLISLVLTIKKLFVQLRSARIQAKATQQISGFYWLQFTIKNSFCLLLLAKAKCTRVLGSFFDRVPSTLTFEYEYQPSTWGSEYEYSKNGTRVVLKYEYCTRVLHHWVALLLFFVTNEKPQRRCFFSQKSGSALALFFKQILCRCRYC